MEQTYPNIDYVFVDNVSKDKSLDVLRQVVAKYPNRHSDVTILFVGHETGTCKAWVSWAFFFRELSWNNLEIILWITRKRLF